MKGQFPQSSADLPLRDIHLPPPPSWWPPAPGWWMLFALVCIACIIGFVIYRRMRRARMWRARIMSEVRSLATRHVDDDAAYAAALHQLLRRAALRYASDAHHLQGEPWRCVLAQVPVDATTLDVLMTLEARMYQPHAPFDRDAAGHAVHQWLHAAWRRVKPVEFGHA
ncbi:DUF4381 family protein [Dyella monticola]|uniref:DUF4381 family protein n=1 Tax=Dyella monticola TaxID=1927958 RepID=A0A370X3N4_9GAMM|nr:DUF4381 family protein [Dyella monticola]RDS82946.1 DUF4381 family protein [Dyella monticola]